jgi:DNA-binding NarL/FixJ family response regulator
MTPLVRLTIVHQELLYGQCLAGALAAKEFAALVALARSAEEAIELCRAHSPDVLLADWNLPGEATLGLIRRVRHECPGVKILVLGLSEDSDLVRACVEAGCANYVLRTESLEHLLVRIGQVMGGGPVPPSSREVPLVAAGAGACLTPREREILKLIDGGLSNKEIAKRLEISLHTVKNHIHNLLTKLDVESRHKAAALVKTRRETYLVQESGVRGQESGVRKEGQPATAAL